jgi:outer membrane immunogenic protein
VSPVAGDFPVASSKTAVGWTADGGLEYAFDDNWIVRGEVRYTEYGGRNFNFFVPGAGPLALKMPFNEVSTTLGASHKL